MKTQTPRDRCKIIIPMPPLAGRDRTDQPMVIAPAPALALRQRAATLGKDGKIEEAVAAWREALHANPHDADVAHELGLALAALGKHEEALTSFERALHYAPAAVAPKLALARALLSLNRAKDARFNFEDILLRDPNNVDALAGLACALRMLSQFEDALRIAEKGVALYSDNPAIVLEKAEALRSLKRPDEAIEPLKHVLALRPGDLEAGLALAKIFIEAKRAAEAVLVLRRIVASHPDDLSAWSDFGCALLATRDYGEAVDAFDRALVLRPTSAATYANLALAFFGQDRLDDALAACDRALAIEPDSSVVHFSKGCIHLARGEFGPGWENYEYRFSMGRNKGLREDVSARPWCGEELRGKSILVLGEQANGDYIQFSRYASALGELGADVSLFVPKRLKRLLSTLPGAVTLLDSIGPHIKPDFQIHLMSLPYRFCQLGLPIPPAPYLAAEPALRERWLARIGNHGLRVGIAWQGWSDGGGGDWRSFRLEKLRPLAAVPGVRLISLQVGKGVEQLDRLTPAMAVETLGPDFDTGEDGFIDSAAVMASLDLVVCCDTGLAHVAGALGTPTWIALLDTPEWRWLRATSESHWYPSVRLFRQPRAHDWDSVFQAMANELSTLQHGGKLGVSRLIREPAADHRIVRV